MRRFGATVSENGAQATLGAEWLDEWRNKDFTHPISKLNNYRRQALDVTQLYHNQNTEARLKKAAGKVPELPEPDVRAKLARGYQEKLKRAHSAFLDVFSEESAKHDALRPFKYEKTAAENTILAEMRAHLRAQKDDKARLALLNNSEFKRAAMQDGVPYELTGLNKLAHDRLYAEAIAEAHPEAVARYADFRQAADVVSAVFKAATASVENELKAVGQPVVERAPVSKKSEPWA